MAVALPQCGRCRAANGARSGVAGSSYGTFRWVNRSGLLLPSASCAGVIVVMTANLFTCFVPLGRRFGRG